LGGVASVKEITEPKITKADYQSKLEILARYSKEDAVTLTSYRPVGEINYRRMFEAAWDGEKLVY